MSKVIAAAVIVAAVCLLGVGALYATRETISKRCEVCGHEIFHETVFFFQAAQTREQAAKLRWCKEDGDASVTVQHISRCEYCGKVIDVREETRPRREEPKNTDERAGYCSDQCRLLAAGRDIYREGRRAVNDAARGLMDAARDLSSQIKR
jgi:hypothetical protein